MSLEDLSLLDINRLVYTYEQTKNAEYAHEALELMDKFQCLHSCYKDLLKATPAPSAKFNTEWELQIQEKSTQKIKDLTDIVTVSQFQEITELSDNKSHLQVNDAIRQLILIYLINGNYIHANNLMIQFAQQLHQTSQPNTIEDIESNKYMQLIFYQYAVKIQMSWFYPHFASSNEAWELPAFNTTESNGNDVTNLNSQSTASESVNNLVSVSNLSNKFSSEECPEKSQEGNHSLTTKTLFKRAHIYYNKNEKLLLQSKSNGPISELQFYWLICWMRLCELFRRGDYKEFYKGFFRLMNTNSIQGENPISTLENCDYKSFKSEILIQFAFSSALILPLKNFTFLNIQQTEAIKLKLIDMFANEPDSLESLFYEYLTLTSQTKFSEAKIFAKKVLFPKLENGFGYIIPECKNVRKSAGLIFVDFFWQTLDYKIFLMIMSNIKRIPTLKLLKFMGYRDEIDEIFKSQMVESLMFFLSVLNLGSSGLGYNVKDDYFFNYGESNNLDNVNKEVDQLSEELISDSVAEMIKGKLIDRFYQVA